MKFRHIALALLFLALMAMAIKSCMDSVTHEVQANLTSSAWGMSVSIETLQPVKHTRVETSVAPNDSYNTHCYSEDDPAEEDKTPITHYYCDYTTDEWLHFRYGETYGVGFLPEWVQPILNPGEVINNATFDEVYELKFTDASGNVYVYNPDNIGEYQSFNGAQNIVLIVNKKGEVTGYRFYNQP